MLKIMLKERDVIFKILSKENLAHRIHQRISLKLKSEVVRHSCWSKNIAFLMLILRTLTYHRNCIWDFEGIFARPQVSQRCYDKAISLHSVFPKPVEAWQFNITTAPVSTMPREDEPSREINAKANPPVATLKRVMSRRHRVIGFSL